MSALHEKKNSGDFQAMQAVLDDLNVRYAHILESIADVFFVLDAGWRFSYLNSHTEQLLDRPATELQGVNIWELLPNAVGTTLYTSAYKAVEDAQPKQFEEYFPEYEKWFAVRLYPSPEGLSIYLTDITEHKEMEEQVRRQSLYDALTDLPNRGLFEGRLTQAILTARNHQSRVVILFLDIDRFKVVNDTLGHVAGDQIIKQVAGRLRDFERGEDMVARFGADEFLVMLHDVKDSKDLRETLARIQEVFRQPFVSKGQEIHLNTSIGISVFPEDGDTVEELVKRADAALYRAKEVGRNTYRFYNPALHTNSYQHLTLENELRKSLVLGQMDLYYQPIVDMATGTPTRVEALIRWNHPQLGVIFPNEFIGLAEETGFITQLGEWVIERACDQIIEWEEKQIPIKSVAVNISPRQFIQFDFDARLEELLSRKKIRPESLQLEITESMAMHNLDSTMKRLQRFKDIGIQVSIDDFGTGHSSLSYLRQLPISRLKVDKSFIKHCIEDERDAAIVRAIVSLGHTLGLGICAEGIETPEQLAFLKEMGGESAQGFLFSKSLPAPEFERWLKGYVPA